MSEKAHSTDHHVFSKTERTPPMKHSISDLQQMYHRYRTQVLFLLLLLIAALISIFQNRFLALAALAAALAFHLAILRPHQKKYVQAFLQANLERTLCPKLGINTVSEKNASRITPALLKNAHLMPFREETGTPLLRWELSGQLRGLFVSLCDVTLAQDFRLVEKGKKRVHFNTGVWTHIELSRNTGMNFRLLHETSVPTPIRMDYFSRESLLIPSPVGDPDLAKAFVLYHPITEEAPVLPGPFLRELKKLAEYTPGYPAVSIQGNQMDIFIRGRFLARPVSVKEPPTEKQLNFDPFPELLYLMDLAASL